MVSPFVALARDKLVPAFEHHQESWGHRPMTPGSDKTAPAHDDPDRPAQTLLGVYFEPPAISRVPDSYDPRSDQRPGAKAGRPRVEFPPTGNPASFAVRAGDLLTRESNGRVYRVFAVRATKIGIVVAEMNASG